MINLTFYLLLLEPSEIASGSCISNQNGRGIGYSFQLAITAPLYSIIGYCIATAQSCWGSPTIRYYLLTGVRIFWIFFMINTQFNVRSVGYKSDEISWWIGVKDHIKLTSEIWQIHTEQHHLSTNKWGTIPPILCLGIAEIYVLRNLFFLLG